MAAADPDRSQKKRKQAETPSEASAPPKKPRPQAPPNTSLLGPHESILSELAPKYDVLAASVISSTQIRKRVGYITTHLLRQPATTRPPVALLHARTADVCKLISVVEQAKRVLREERGAWVQYNQLFELPREAAETKGVVEETVLEQDAEDDDGDDFEVMESRFEKAVLPPVSTRAVKSMRVFLSIAAVPELKAKPGVTVQSSDETKS